MKVYRFVAIDKHEERRCWAWGSTFKIAEKRIKQAIREFIRMEGTNYGQFDEWTLKWEERQEGETDDRQYLPKPKKKPAPRTRRRNPEP